MNLIEIYSFIHGLEINLIKFLIFRLVVRIVKIENNKKKIKDLFIV